MIRILSPVCGADDAAAVIGAGASEVYCGVMTQDWQKRYTNVGSPNRREWRVSSMRGYDELEAVAAASHVRGARVFLALNALYTAGQHGAVREQVQAAMGAGVDALIVADLGLLLALRDNGWTRDIHISTGGTSFNSETVAFYRDLGACRVILPRQNRVREIAAIKAAHPDFEIEAFILNRGCKNIDGFCTFHHGTNEIQRGWWWNIPKKLHADHYVLNALKLMPRGLRDALSRTRLISSDSACFLPYESTVVSGAGAREIAALRKNLRDNFNLFNGFDTCGACALWDFDRAGLCSVKIVGRSNPIEKKLKDVRFLKTCIDRLAGGAPSREDYSAFVRQAYESVYGFGCNRWCYYPEEDSALNEGEL